MKMDGENGRLLSEINNSFYDNQETVNLLSKMVNHIENPAHRRNLRPNAIHLQEGAWLGASVTVLTDVTIGKNTIVGTGLLVTKDVQPNTVVDGSPAKYIRKIRTK